MTLSPNIYAIATETKIAVGLLLAGWAIVTQQVLAAFIHACMVAYVSSGPNYISGNMQSYLLWRMRLPTHAMSWGVKVANVAAGIVVLIVLLVAWRWLT